MATINNKPSMDGVVRVIYDAIIEEISDTIAVAIRDALRVQEERILQTVRREVDGKLEPLSSRYETELKFLRDDYVKSLEYLVKSLPTPIVNVETPKTEIKFPENAIQVKVESELKQAPKKTKTEKSVVYGSTGRPEKIIEEVSVTDE